MKSGTFCSGFSRWAYVWFVHTPASTWPTATAKACPAFWTSTNPFWTIWRFHFQTLKSWDVRTRDLRVSWLPFLKSGFSTNSKWFRYDFIHNKYYNNINININIHNNNRWSNNNVVTHSNCITFSFNISNKTTTTTDIIVGRQTDLSAWFVVMDRLSVCSEVITKMSARMSDLDLVKIP